MALPIRRSSPEPSIDQTSLELPEAAPSLVMPRDVEAPAVLPEVHDALPSLDEIPGFDDLSLPDLDFTDNNTSQKAPEPKTGNFEIGEHDFDDLFSDDPLIREDSDFGQEDEDLFSSNTKPLEQKSNSRSNIDDGLDDDLANDFEPKSDENDWANDFEKTLHNDSDSFGDLDTKESDNDTDEDFSKDLKGDEEPEGESTQAPLSKKKSDKKKKPGKNKKAKKASIFTRISEGIFRSLTLIPFIGKIFKPLQRFAKYLFPVVALFLLLAIPLGLYFIAGSAIATTATTTFPDSGSATLSDLSFNQNTMTASGKILNTGSVIADVTPVFTVWSYEISLNPSKWVAYQNLGTCTGAIVSVNIDSSVNVSAKCAFAKVSGITPKVSGKLVY